MRDLAGIALVLAAMAALEIPAAREDSQTYDEAVHLAAGYRYLTTGDFRFNPEHPPLAKMLDALPLLWLKPDLPAAAPEWNGDARMSGAAFLYRNRIDPDTLLGAGRAMAMAQTLLLGALLGWWTRRTFGGAAALLAVLLYALDPNVLAHGRYVTTDIPAALWSFAAVIGWAAYLERPGRGRLLGSGAALGCALATKFSCVFLVPAYFVLWLAWRWKGGRPRALALAAAYGIALATVALVYGPETWRALFRPSSVPPLASRIERTTLFGRVLYAGASALHTPSHEFVVGLESAARHDRIGHPSYLLGQTGRGGRWEYFPVAFAVKSPVALLAAVLAALILLPLRMPLKLREIRFAWFVLAVPLCLYAALAVNSRLNIGIRHLLPAYPFLFALLGAALARRRALACAVGALALAEAVWIYPHHLAFFNALAGGPSSGPRYLLDSNLDWGQDVRRLRRWLDDRGNPPVCFAYFGTADTEWYGVPHNGIPRSNETEARSRLNCVAAISANLLHDLYLEPGAYDWLRRLRPAGHAGWSIYIYDLRRPVAELHNSYKRPN